MDHTNINVPGAFAKSFQCPCCKNPWNQNQSDSTAVASGFVGSPNPTNVIACGPCLSDNKGFSGLDPANIDFSTTPGEDFFLWSNGNWKKNNPIPNEYSSWNTFMVLRDLNLERLKNLLEALMAGEGKGEDFLKVKNCYQSFMNDEEIEKTGLTPLKQGIDLCWNIVNRPTNTVARLHSEYGLSILFNLSSAPDKANSEWTIASLYQSGLGLPDRDYYFDADKKEKRVKYIEYIKNLLNLYKTNNSANEFSFPNSFDSEAVANQIFEMEKEIASFHLTRTLSRDPNNTYNKMSFETLIDESMKYWTESISWALYLTYGSQPRTAFQWDEYFSTLGKPPKDLNNEVNLSSKEYLFRISYIMNKYSGILPFYCLFHLLNSFTSHLPSAFIQLSFDFYEKELKGTQELLPRWKRGLNILEGMVGELLGQFYVEKYFSPNMKTQIVEMVEKIREVLTQRLHEITWMSAESKKEAFIKIAKFKIKVGYPDQWKDYSKLQVSMNKHIENIRASRSFESQIELDRMNAPTDKTRWFMTPQTVNAYYHPSLNEIVFPAAILQPPFYDANADLAVQYGSLGAVVGHEMTHGFDDQVRIHIFIFLVIFFSNFHLSY
jgi:putative endopeptidase